jgi:hypothetical protein
MEVCLRVYAGRSLDAEYKTLLVSELTDVRQVLEKVAPWYLDADLATEHIALILVNSEQQERLLQDFENPLQLMNRAQRSVRFIVTRIDRHKSVVTERWAVQASLKDALVVREGYLMKLCKGRLVQRYFKLDTLRLYYSHSSRTISQAFTIIRLETASAVLVLSNKQTFKIETPLKSYTLKCNSSEDRLKWMQCITKQSSIIKENRLFSELDRKIVAEEHKKAQSDNFRCISFLEFQGIVNSSEGRDLLYSCLERTPELEVLRDIESFKRATHRPQAEETGRGIINSLAKISTYSDTAISLAQIWLKYSASRQPPPKTLFDEVVNCELRKAEPQFASIRRSQVFWQLLCSLLARQVLSDFM